MLRLLLLLLLLLALAAPAGGAAAQSPAPASGDEIATASRSVVRVVVLAVDGGAVVGFGHGSGFAVESGRIVTNAHVVALAARYPDNVVIGVVPSRGAKSYAARLVAIDPTRDLALLELREGSVPPATLFMGALAGGTDVVALGYPGSVDLATARSAEDYITPQAPTRSEGNFSDSREVNGLQALLHTATIGRGNSGGPLLDECGRVVGVNTFITRGGSGEAPFAFAIANSELAAFLREAGQSFTATGGACVTRAAAAAAAAQDRAQQDRRDSDARRIAAELRQAELAAALREVEDARDDRLAIALLLAGLGLVAFAGAGLLAWKDRMRHAAILAGLGLALAVAGAAAFLTRPDLTVKLRAPAAAMKAGEPVIEMSNSAPSEETIGELSGLGYIRAS